MEKAVQPLISGTVKGDRFDDMEHRLQMPGGEVKWVRNTGRIIRNDDGEITEVVGAVQDITGQKNIQLKLEQEKRFSDKIINSLPILFFMFDASGNIIRWNEHLKNVTGYSEIEMSYLNPSGYFAPEEREVVQAKIQEVFEKGSITLEANIVSKNDVKTPF